MNLLIILLLLLTDCPAGINLKYLIEFIFEYTNLNI